MIELSNEFFLLEKRLFQLRGDLTATPDASIVIPVNAQKDLANIPRLLSDIARYSGEKRLEVILVINNYPSNDLPYEIELYRQIGLIVIAIPRVDHEGGVAIAARIPGIRAARSAAILLFDADCRIPNPTALIRWYLAQFEAGSDLAYTHVDYIDLSPAISVKARMWVHHASRWLRRNILGIPTSRGSNYAIRRNLILDLFEDGRIPYDLHVGPAVKSIGGKITYSGARELVVLTSGRFFAPGWKVLADYLIWRVGYYRRILKMKAKKTVTD
jgi:glycosyltransferase involved in cell wall biosynthesis